MSSWSVKGKFAIVTGAGSGINHAFAEQLLDAGCSVIFADIQLRPEAEETLAKFPHPPTRDGAPSAVYHKTDQGDWSQIDDLWNTSLKTFGRIDLICPGAGLWEPPSSSFWEPAGISSLAEDDPNALVGNWRTFAVNTMGPLRLAQLAMDYWLQNKIAGNVLFVASLGGYVATIGTPLYYASKAALLSVTQAMAQMRQRLNIRVAAIAPGPTFTPIFDYDYCRNKVRKEDLTMTPRECAEVMLRISQDPEYGDGQVVEAMMLGTKEEPNLNVRIVPVTALYPSVAPMGEDNNIIKEEEKLWSRLQTQGMR